jgi:DUF971 family protein
MPHNPEGGNCEYLRRENAYFRLWRDVPATVRQNTPDTAGNKDLSMTQHDQTATAHPEEIRLNPDKDQLTVTFPDASYTLTAEMLRVTSPSAEVQGHSPSERVTVGGKRDVTITRIDPVGNYAVKLVFSDGHDTGIFSWSYLRKLGVERDEIWQQYLNELSEKGLSRDK